MKTKSNSFRPDLDVEVDAGHTNRTEMNAPGSHVVRSSSRRSVLRAMMMLPFGAFAGRSAAAGLEQFYKFNIKPEVFLEEVFGAEVPVAQSVAVGAAPVQLIQPLPQRMRYWRANGKTVWIFDELGKDGYLPTTCAFVVKDASIERAKVLIYRESRGEQVGQPSFLQQLVGAKAAGAGIDKTVDNISGATYSVKMMQRMARTALALDQLAV
jgi:hypothetical protein